MQNNNNNNKKGDKKNNSFWTPSISPTTNSPFKPLPPPRSIDEIFEEESKAESKFQIENFAQISDLEEMYSLREEFLASYGNHNTDYFFITQDQNEELINCENEAEILQVIEKIADDSFIDYMIDFPKFHAAKNREELFKDFCNSGLLKDINEARDYFSKTYLAMTNHINKLEAAIKVEGNIDADEDIAASTIPDGPT